MANSVNFSTYGFLDDILALTEENWRRYFKPFIYDSVQNGLQVSAGSGMTVNVSSGECRCGSIMGILSSPVSLDVYVGDETYPRIDCIIAQYTYDDPSTLVVAVLKGTAGETPVAPSLVKSYNSLWQMELAQILVPAGATTTAECTITDKRVIYNSLDDKLSIYSSNASEWDNTPIAGSTNPVTSNGIKTALDSKQDTLTFDNVPTEDSSNPVKSGGIFTALSGKSDTGHNHDDRYYTESEVNSLLATKQNTLILPLQTNLGGTGGIDTGWQSITDSSVFTGIIYYRRIGAFVTITAYDIKLVTGLETAGDAVILCTMPEGIRTKVSIHAYTWNASNPGMLALWTSRQLQLNCGNNQGWATTKGIKFNMSFIVNS